MLNKRGAIEELPPALPSLLLLGLILVTFGIYFFACDVTSVFGFCGGKSVDVTIQSTELSSSSRLLTLLQTPVVVQNEKVRFADMLVKTYESLPEDDIAYLVQSQLGKTYVQEADRLLNGMIPEDMKGKVVWELKVIALPQKKAMAALTRAPEGGGMSARGDVLQTAILPLETKSGALRIELGLLCRDCSEEIVGRLR